MHRGTILTTAVLVLAVCAFAHPAEKISEENAVDQVKKATASLLDPALPRRSFGAWVTEKFEGWDVQWMMHDCGAGTFVTAGKTSKGDSSDSPICVQVNIMQPAQKIHGDASDGFHLLFQVGTERKGFLPTPRVRTAIRTDGGDVEQLNNLSEVEP